MNDLLFIKKTEKEKVVTKGRFLCENRT